MTPLFFDTKGAKKSSQKKRRCACERERRDFLEKVAQKLFFSGAVLTHPTSDRKDKQ